MRRFFYDEILEKSLSFVFVKEKIIGSKIFKKEDFKRVYDRVRAEWRFFSSDDKLELILLIERDEMKDRVDCMFREDVFSEDFISDIVLFILIFFRVKVFFFEDYVRILFCLFEDMMGNVLIFKNEIFKRFFNDVEGKEMILVLFVS